MRISSIVVLFTASLLLLSCDDSPQLTDGRTVFRYNEMGAITSLDPAASSSFENIWAVNQLFNGLVQVDDSLHILPCIAKSWEVSQDGLNYIFHLRNDVFFHPHPAFAGSTSRKVNADDFVFSFNRLNDPEVSRAMSLLEVFDFSQEKNSTLRSALSAVNDSTLCIRLKRPFRPLLNLLTMKYFSVVPKEAVEFSGKDFGKYPVGTGPFCFKMWDDSKLIFLKNNRYFEKEGGQPLPFLDAVNVSFIKDKQSAFLQLLRGEIDLISGTDAINIDVVFDQEGKLYPDFQNKIQVMTGPYLKTDYLGFFIEKREGDSLNPVKIKAIRQAINYGFDREKMMRYFRNNIGRPAHNGFLPPGLSGYNNNKVHGYQYNPQKSRQLLTEAGFNDNNKLPEITLHVTDNYSDIAEFIQSQLNNVGIKMSVLVEPAREINKAVFSGQYDFFRKSWICDYPDPENFLFLFYSKNYTPNGPNYFHFQNSEFDHCFELSQTEKNDSIRMELFYKMEKIILDESPVVPLFYDQVVRLTGVGISGMSINPMNLLDLRRVKKEMR